MKHAVALFTASLAAVTAFDRWLGFPAATEFAFGAVAVMSVFISLTFLWLWYERATPLALGMAYSWAGTAVLMVWCWGLPLADDARKPGGLVFVFLSLQIVGAVLHFAVMQRSMGYGRGAFAVPIAVALAVSAVAQFAG